MNDSRLTMSYHPVDAEAMRARFALRVTALLSEHSEATTHDVGERLRFARERALDRARALRATAPSPVLQVQVHGAGMLALGGGPRSTWWRKLAAVLPLLVLLAGLALIQNHHVRDRITAAAEIDFDLLADELPPTAYSDPGFLEFLKTSSGD